MATSMCRAEFEPGEGAESPPTLHSQAIVDQRPSKRLGRQLLVRAGRRVPEKRTRRPRRSRWRRTCVLTRTATPTETIGLTTAGRSVISTRYCVFSATVSNGNEKAPCALVSCALAALAKPCVYG